MSTSPQSAHPMHPADSDAVPPTTPDKPPRAGTVTWLAMLAVMVITLLVFLPTLRNGFVTWDDPRILLRNPCYRGLDWQHVTWAFRTRTMGHYQPLTWLSYSVDYVLWGMDPKGYHLTSLLFHVATAGVFFWVARHLLFQALCRGAEPSDWSLSLAAALAALLFAIHPLRVENVAWATERRDLTSGLFYMVTLVAYLRAVTRGGSAPARIAWLTAALIAYALSLLGKAIGITLPVILVIVDAYPLRRFGPFGRGWLARNVKHVWWEKLPFFALALAAAVNLWWVQTAGAAVAKLDQVPWLARLVLASFGTAFYLFKTVLPMNLSPLYAPPIPFHPFAWYFTLSIATLAGITLVVVATARRWPAGLALWLAYLVTLSPVVGIIQTGPQMAADRYTYLSCLGWAVLLAAGWLGLCRRRAKSPAWRVGFVAASVALIPMLASLGWLTARQIGIWRDTGTLWRQALRVQPGNAIAHGNLASWLTQHGQLEQALYHHRRNVELRPGDARAHANLGVTLAKLRRYDEAEDAYRKALEIDRNSVEAAKGLARILIVTRDPDRVREGFDLFEALVQRQPRSVPDRIELAEGCLRHRQYGRAERTLRQGHRLMPENPYLAGMLAWILATCPDARFRNGDEALGLARQAADQTDHRNPSILDTLAAALAETGHFDQAVQVAQRAVELERQAGRDRVAESVERRIANYERHKPWRDAN